VIAAPLAGLALPAIWHLHPVFQNGATMLFRQTDAVNCAALGAIIAATAIIRTIERYETRHSHPDRSVLGLQSALTGCAAALAVCLAVVVHSGGIGTFVATGFSAFTLASIVVVRRLGLGPWGILAIAVSGVGLAGLLTFSQPGLSSKGFTLAFAANAPPATLSMSQRILDDAPVLGTGAGTFAAIAPIYRDMEDETPSLEPPTAALAVEVELGRPMLWFSILTAAGSLLLLLRAAVQRGRDSFYPAAGAACLVTVSFLFFMNVGVFGAGSTLITAAALGLAFAQSKGRTIQQ
jgi:hypothetical protein